MWGKGEAKSLEDLAREEDRGESRLNDKGEKLFREITAVGVNVYYAKEGTFLKLCEDRQVFKDRRVVRRPEQGTLIREKILADESPMAAVFRGLEKRLGFKTHLELIEQPESTQETAKQPYPGLVSRYSFKNFSIIVTDDMYKAEGYSEVQLEKTTYFVWRVITEKEFEDLFTEAKNRVRRQRNK